MSQSPLSLPGRAVAARDVSVDVLRGVVMCAMVFVNDVAGLAIDGDVGFSDRK